jgi:hypothetical protein
MRPEELQRLIDASPGRRLGRASAELTDPSTARLLASAVGTFARTAPAPE